MEGKLEKVREFTASTQAYRPPKAVSLDDASDIQDLDEIKLHELKEVRNVKISATFVALKPSKIFFNQCFNLFDLNNDGFICANDLRGTFNTMGMDVSDETIQQMMKDGSAPMNFDSFAMMMCFKTMELEPEIVLLEAFSKWDERVQGVISLDR
jgi:myosin regulatory light chain 12